MFPSKALLPNMSVSVIFKLELRFARKLPCPNLNSWLVYGQCLPKKNSKLASMVCPKCANTFHQYQKIDIKIEERLPQNFKKKSNGVFQRTAWQSKILTEFSRY